MFFKSKYEYNSVADCQVMDGNIRLFCSCVLYNQGIQYSVSINKFYPASSIHYPVSSTRHSVLSSSQYPVSSIHYYPVFSIHKLVSSLRSPVFCVICGYQILRQNIPKNPFRSFPVIPANAPLDFQPVCIYEIPANVYFTT